MMFDCGCHVSLADTPVVLVQLVENPPWIKRDGGEFTQDRIIPQYDCIINKHLYG